LSGQANNWWSEGIDLTLLNKIAQRISTAVPLREVLGDVVEFVAAVIECDSCMIYVLEGDDLVLRASKNAHPEVIDRLRVKVGHGITGWVARQQTPVVIPEAACKDPRFKLFNELPEDSFEAFLSVPMVSGGRLVGVINLQDRARRVYTKRETGLMATLGFLIGSEVERARLRSENSLIEEKLGERTAFERAKRILQNELKISEEEAYLTLQRESRRRRKSLKELAESIILSEEVKMNVKSVPEAPTESN
jgi:uroporphyrinogen-III synthase